MVKLIVQEIKQSAPEINSKHSPYAVFLEVSGFSVVNPKWRRNSAQAYILAEYI